MAAHLARRCGIGHRRDDLRAHCAGSACPSTGIWRSACIPRFLRTRAPSVTPIRRRKACGYAATLIEAGADPWLVTENVYESYSLYRLKLLGSVSGSMERSADGRIAWVVVTDELFRQTGTTAEDTDNFVNFVRSVKGVEVAILFRQTAPSTVQDQPSLQGPGRSLRPGTVPGRRRPQECRRQHAGRHASRRLNAGSSAK